MAAETNAAAAALASAPSAPKLRKASASGGQGKVGFLLTEVDAEREDSDAAGTVGTLGTSASAGAIFTTAGGPATLSPSSDIDPSIKKDRLETHVALPLISVYRVEDAALPAEVTDDYSMFAPLPATIPMDLVMTNIVQNLDFKAWSEHARSMWFKDFKSMPSRAVISDMFWFSICWYFKSKQHPDVEKRLYDRISANFVGLFSSVGPTRKDFFFRCYADAVAQAVLYAMFLAYPKSRVHFTEKFRKDLVIRISYWTTGVCPEFVDAAHWKLNLGGGDVLQSTMSQAAGRQTGALVAAQPMMGGADAVAGKRASITHRAPRPLRTLRYSPLVAHFLRSRKYSSVNLVQPTRMSVTAAEERSLLMDAKHAMLLDRANAAREHCDGVVNDYNELCAENRRQERQRQLQAQTAKKRLEIRRKEVLRSDPHEYANYLVSLHLLQQGIGQNA
eukprot:TRINITY_DN93469_c0_g1_i1.p1 TRINITY_DN93469_c0_g1~~TRINITY_DN93469_c0_g1_i1.p1  ORF type:complete len:447 (+),score=82.33 TRINITY_DN93469_c0_g1_i1:79-1419(+)